jgi:hypothetical protein
MRRSRKLDSESVVEGLEFGLAASGTENLTVGFLMSIFGESRLWRSDFWPPLPFTKARLTMRTP